jgi:hypothetical protein
MLVNLNKAKLMVRESIPIQMEGHSKVSGLMESLITKASLSILGEIR